MKGFGILKVKVVNDDGKMLFPVDLTLTGRESSRVGAAKEKTLDPMLVPTRGTKRKLKLDDRRCLGFFTVMAKLVIVSGS